MQHPVLAAPSRGHRHRFLLYPVGDLAHPLLLRRFEGHGHPFYWVSAQSRAACPATAKQSIGMALVKKNTVLTSGMASSLGPLLFGLGVRRTSHAQMHS